MVFDPLRADVSKPLLEFALVPSPRPKGHLRCFPRSSLGPMVPGKTCIGLHLARANSVGDLLGAIWLREVVMGQREVLAIVAQYTLTKHAVPHEEDAWPRAERGETWREFDVETHSLFSFKGCIPAYESDHLGAHHKRDTKTRLLMADPWGSPDGRSSPVLRCSEVDLAEAMASQQLAF
jgi:hypothetical protein